MNIHFGRRYSLIIGLLIVGAILSLSAGAVWISPIAVIKEVWSGDNFILSEFRVPRMLLGILVGGGISDFGCSHSRCHSKSSCVTGCYWDYERGKFSGGYCHYCVPDCAFICASSCFIYWGISHQSHFIPVD